MFAQRAYLSQERGGGGQDPKFEKKNVFMQVMIARAVLTETPAVSTVDEWGGGGGVGTSANHLDCTDQQEPEVLVLSARCS